MIETIRRDKHNRRTIFQFTSVFVPRMERTAQTTHKSLSVIPDLPCPFVEKGESTCQASTQTVL